MMSCNESVSKTHYRIIEGINSSGKSKSDIDNDLNQYYLDNALSLFEYFNTGRKILTLADLGKPAAPTPQSKTIAKYRKNNAYRDPTNYDFDSDKAEELLCDTCKSKQIFDEDRLICITCGTVEDYFTIVAQQTSNFINTTVLRTRYFDIYIDNLLGRNITKIPQDIIDTCRMEMKKRNSATETDIHDYLKKHRLSKYYSRAFQISGILTGQQRLYISGTQELNIKTLYKIIQTPMIDAQPDRDNFSSMNYVFYKICQRLKYYDILPSIKLQKSHILSRNENAWKKVCKELEWEFERVI